MKKLTLALFMIFSTPLAWATNYCNDASIIACYPAQENTGTSLIDNSPNSLNGSFTSAGNPAWATASPSRSYLTYSLNYTSGTQYVSVSTSNVFKPSVSTSMVLWIFPTATSVGGGAPRINSDNGQNAFALVNANNVVSLGINGTVQIFSTTSNNSITLNAWNHLVITWDGSNTATNIHIYVNGAEVTYQTQTNGSGLTSPTSPLFIGNNPAGTRNITGKITEIAFFSRVLSSSEVSDIYNNGLLQTQTSTVSTIYTGSTGVIRGATIN